MAGYTRNDVTNNIANGNIVDAADLDGEFDAIQAAFDAATGHKHDGTVGNGAPIEAIGPTQDVVATASALRPKVDNTVDLGTSTLEYKDLWIDGVANIDSLVADTADINAGTIDGTAIGGAVRSTGAFTTLTLTNDLAVADGGTGASDAATARTNLGLAIGTNVQAYDAGLQSISGLTTAADRMIYTTAADTYAVTPLTSFGRNLLDDADAATARGTLGLGSMSTQNSGTVSITGGTITGITDLAVADGGTGASDAAGARTNLGLAIGTNVQAYDAGLQSISGLTTAADRMIYTTAADTYAVTPLTSFARGLLDDADAATARTTLGLTIGTNVQAYDAELAAIAALAVTDGNFIVGNGTTWVAEAPATARTSLGLGTMATQNSASVSITGGSITGITDLAVADGGTGASDAATARTNLGIGTMGTQSAASVAITGGTIDGTTVGATTPSSGAFTTLSATTTISSGTQFLAAAGSASAPSYAFTGDTNCGFYSMGANRIGVSTGNSIMANFVDTGDGVLNVGDHAARTNVRYSSTLTQTPRLQVEGTGSNTGISLIRNSTSVNAPVYFSMGRSKGAADGDNTVLADADIVGTFQFVGADGTNLSIGALIRAAVDGTPATDSVPMELSFRTLAQGDTTVTERMILTSNGRLRLLNTGVLATADDDGTLTTGTYTPTPLGGNFKRIINGGAFTLAAPTASEDYTLTIQITNNATAGAITLSGFSKTGGDSFTTTDGHDFFVFITKCNGFTSATVQALQ